MPTAWERCWPSPSSTKTTDELGRETRAAQLRSWLVVAGTMLAMYLLIFKLVQRGSETIDTQRRQLGDKVAELSAVVKQNALVSNRISPSARSWAGPSCRSAEIRRKKRSLSAVVRTAAHLVVRARESAHAAGGTRR